MRFDWPTETIDMQAAANVIDKYREYQEDEPLSLVEFVIDEEEEDITVRPADWVMELAKLFREKYGYEHGQAVTSHILTRCFLQGETLH